MRRLSLPLVLCVVLGATALAGPAGARTQRAGGPYAELQFGISGVRHSALDFVSPIASVGAGVYVLPGVGLEVFADAPLARGGASRFEAGVSEAYGAALRFRSPSEGGLHGYIVLGYVEFVVEQESLDTERTIEEDFSGVRASIGVMQRFARTPAFALSAEYRNFYSGDSMQVDGLAVGLRFDLR